MQEFIKKMLSSAPQTVVKQPETVKPLTLKEIATQQYNSYSPQLKTMIEAMALQESQNGKYRGGSTGMYGGKMSNFGKNDQPFSKTDVNSYGLLHQGQDYTNQFNKIKTEYGYNGPDLKAKDYINENSDIIQKYIAGSRIKKDMTKNNRDLYTSTRYTQNYNDPNYATSTMNKYVNTLSSDTP